jgi:hypothetical protein
MHLAAARARGKLNAMRLVLRRSRVLLVSLLLWAASPALGASALASDVFWVDVATNAAAASPPLAERRARRSRAVRRAMPAPRCVRGARNPILRSQQLPALRPIYLRHCVLLR